MKVLLFQLDGSLPNIALMRIAAHHHARGDEVELRVAGNIQAVQRRLFENPPWKVYASLIFEKTCSVAQYLQQVYPQAIIGGTGWDLSTTVEQYGVTTSEMDYSIYPRFRSSIGFSQRGCRLKCEFCVVPRKEGAVREVDGIYGIWRGEPWPKEILLLDNDFFGQPRWRDRIREIREGGFKVSLSQGINARCLTEEAAEAIASVDYRDDSMKVKRIYTAWDSRGDESRLMAGLNRLVKYGVKPDNIMVFMLIGYWPGETHEDRDYRRRRLREFGARPYPMPYYRTRELVGFQRWVIGAYDKPSSKWEHGVPWSEWVKAKYQPANLQDDDWQQMYLNGNWEGLSETRGGG